MRIWKFILYVAHIILCASTLHAQEITKSFSYQNFEQAKSAPNQLKFTVVSTKVGLFSSDVDGYALEFSANSKMDPQNLSDMTLIIKSAGLNTDGGSRDEKLHDLCLSAKEFPEIKVQIVGPYNYQTGKKQSLPAIVTIRGKEKQANVELEASSNGDFISVSAESVWKLSSMEIPDPSIAVAKLSDEIKIHIKLQLPLTK